MFCYNCGEKLEEDDKFCSKCGSPSRKNKVEEKSNEVVEEKPIKKKKSLIKSLIYKTIVSLLAICVIIEIFLIITGIGPEIHLKVILSMVYTGLFGFLGIQFANLYEKSNYKNLAIFALLISVVLFVISSLMCWKVINIESDFIIKILYSLLIICIAIYHASHLILIKFKNPTAEKVLSVSLFLIIGLFLETDNEFYLKTILIFSILTLFSSIATPIINKIN